MSLLRYFQRSRLGGKSGAHHGSQDFTPNLTNGILVLGNLLGDRATLLSDIGHVPLEAGDSVDVVVLLLGSLLLDFFGAELGLLLHHSAPVGEHVGHITRETLSHETVIERAVACQLVQVLITTAVLVGDRKVAHHLNGAVADHVEPVD